MDIEISETQGVTVARLSGEINSRTAPTVQDGLLPLVQPGCKVVLDMRRVPYMSSAGLRTLLLLYRQIDNQNGRVVLTGLSETIRDTMSIIGFLDFFDAYPTIAQGIAALTSPPARA